MRKIDNYFYFENEKVCKQVSKILKLDFDIVQFKFEEKYSIWTKYQFDPRNISFFSEKVITQFMQENFIIDIKDIAKYSLVEFCEKNEFTCVNIPMDPFVRELHFEPNELKKRTIVFVSDIIRGTGGINQVYSNLAEAFYNNGYDVKLWGIFDKGMKEEPIPSENLFYYTDNVYYSPKVEKINKELETYKDPIFIISSSTIYSALIEHIEKYTIINHYHNCISTLLKNYYYEPTRFNNIEKFIGDGYTRDMLIMMSKTEAVYMKNISKNDVDCVYNYTPIVEKKKIHSQKADIVWSGRMNGKAKNFDDVVRLAQKIKNKSLEIRIHVYSAIDEEIVKSIEKLGIEDILIFHDYTSNKDEIYADKKILILTSFNEGNPMVINEAIQYEVIPVLYRSCFFIDEFLLNDEKQYVVDNVDGMLNSIIDIIENGKEFVKPNVPVYTSMEIVEEWNRVFKKAVYNRNNRLIQDPLDQISLLKKEIEVLKENRR